MFEQLTGRQRSCTTCVGDIMDIYETQGGANRAARAAAKYGIDQQTFLHLLLKQNGRCRICQQEKKLVIDHDHTTDVVRGLLCSSCNSGIGLLQENPEILESAVAYLRLHHRRRAKVLAQTQEA